MEWVFGNTHYSLGKDVIDSLVASSSSAVDPLSRVQKRQIDLSALQAVGRGKAVLVGARLITMRGAEVIENGSVSISEGVIDDVGRSSDVVVPPGATVIDVHGRTVMPGFIDAHAHLTDLPRDLLDANNGEALIYPAFGVTTVKDPSNGGVHKYTYSELLRSGDMVGPRLFGSEALISRDQSIESFEDALAIAKRTRTLGGTYLKYHTGFDREQRHWLISASREIGLGFAAHWPATNYSPGRLNLSTVVDGTETAEHAVNYGRQKFDDIVQFLSRSGVVFNSASVGSEAGYPGRYWDSIKNDLRIQNFYVGDLPRKRESVDDLAAEGDLAGLGWVEDSNAGLVADVTKAGGLVSIGSHGDFDGIGFHLEMWAHARAGMSIHDVLRAATINGAMAVGAEDEIGSIEPGKVADLIILRENPLEDIRNTLSVEQVMQGGILRDAETLDEVWPSRKALPKWKASAELGSINTKAVATH